MLGGLLWEKIQPAFSIYKNLVYRMDPEFERLYFSKAVRCGVGGVPILNHNIANRKLCLMIQNVLVV
jgi:hypothetical protein